MRDIAHSYGRSASLKSIDEPCIYIMSEGCVRCTDSRQCSGLSDRGSYNYGIPLYLRRRGWDRRPPIPLLQMPLRPCKTALCKVVTITARPMRTPFAMHNQSIRASPIPKAIRSPPFTMPEGISIPFCQTSEYRTTHECDTSCYEKADCRTSNFTWSAVHGRNVGLRRHRRAAC